MYTVRKKTIMRAVDGEQKGIIMVNQAGVPSTPTTVKRAVRSKYLAKLSVVRDFETGGILI
jgi:hypothetical protein